MKSVLRLSASSAILLCAFLASCATTMPPPPRTGQMAMTFSCVRERRIDMRFQLFLPRDYGAVPEKRWPLILFLHGAGERGDDVEKVKVHGPPKIAERTPDFPFIVVSPQCPSGETWNDEALEALLDHALANWAIDAHRVYLTGLSMGGYGAWSLAQACPERFAAVVPICGGGSAARANLYGDSPRGKALRELPFWAFHGEKDDVVPPRESERMVEALRKLGCDVRYTVVPGVGHDAWVKAYDDPKLYTWLLAHARN